MSDKTGNESQNNTPKNKHFNQAFIYVFYTQFRRIVN
jgi:hypothetical protein